MSVWQAATLGAWVLLLCNFALTLRVVRRLRADDEQRQLTEELLHAPDLAVGAPAPPFRARTLDGDSVGLEDYAGRTVAFVVVSPECPTCRREIRGLVHLARVARENVGVALVLVSDFGPTATAAWLETVAREDRIAIDVPVLLAPPSVSNFLPQYDPRVVTPYYCLIDEDATVVSRGPVGAGEWLRLRGSWEGANVQTARRRMSR